MASSGSSGQQDKKGVLERDGFSVNHAVIHDMLDPQGNSIGNVEGVRKGGPSIVENSKRVSDSERDVRTKSKRGEHRAALSLLAGGIAGTVAKTVIAPLDRVKILFQVSPEPFSLRLAGRAIIDIARTDGVAALWRGNSATALRVFPYAGIQFMTFDLLKRRAFQDNNAAPLSNIQRAQMGAIAGFVSVVCTYPLDVLRARLAVQTGSGRFNSLFHAATSMYRTEGISTFYKGMKPTLLGIVPYAGIAFSLNEFFRGKLHRDPDGSAAAGAPSIPVKMLSGALAGLIAQSATYPLDVVRRRMQTEGYIAASLRPGATRPLCIAGLWPSFCLIVKESGWRGLFKGLPMNWIKGPMSMSVSFTTFDAVKGLLDIADEPVSGHSF